MGLVFTYMVFNLIIPIRCKTSHHTYIYSNNNAFKWQQILIFDDMERLLERKPLFLQGQYCNKPICPMYSTAQRYLICSQAIHVSNPYSNQIPSTSPNNKEKEIEKCYKFLHVKYTYDEECETSNGVLFYIRLFFSGVKPPMSRVKYQYIYSFPRLACLN